MNRCVVLIRDHRGEQDETEVRRSQFLYAEIVHPAVESVGLVCERVDPHDFGVNDARVFCMLAAAEAMIVDTSSGSMDYLYSLGVRHALTDKPTLILIRGRRPFDISFPKGVIQVSDDQLSAVDVEDLRREIAAYLSEGLAAKHEESYSPVRTAIEQVPRVFLSYSHSDAEAVLAVDQWLRDRGARVDIDERNFVAGRDIRDEIVRYVKRAGKVVCFYSVASADRYYPKLERRLAEEVEQELHNAGNERPVLLYFRLDKTALPPESSCRLAVNAWCLSFRDACNELWRHILERSAEPRPIPLSRYRTRAPWQ